ncbi:MAG: hypothetical protein P9L99_06105 [Candidatus Lernaella stagnicola]|nr:hypothetical protein [Candidatus Lernaella stagnicola]
MKHWAVLLACVAICFYLLLVTAPGERTALDPTAAGSRLYVDFAVQTYAVHAAAGFVANTGRVWGYDPFLLGGYPDAFTWHSYLVSQIFAVFFPGSPDTALRLSILLLWLLIPLALVAAGFATAGPERPWIGAAAGILGVTLFQGALGALLFHSGMTTAVVEMHLSLLGLALLAGYLERGGARRLMALGMAAVVALLVHKISVVTFALPGVVMAVVYLGRAPARRYAALAAVAFVTLAVNAFWLVPFFRFVGETMFRAETSHWVNADVLAVVKDFIDPHAAIGAAQRPTGWVTLAFRWILYGAGVYGLVVSYRTRPRLAAAWGAAWAVIFALAYFGSLVPGLFIFDPCVYVLLAEIMAVVGAAWAVGHLTRRASTTRVVAVLVVLALFGAPIAWLRNTAAPTISPERIQADTGLWRRLAERIAETDTGAGRVMFETWNLFYAARDPLPDNTALYGHLILPRATGKPFLSGHYPNYFIKYNLVNFTAGRLGERPIEKVGVAEFRHYLDAYQVRLIVAHSPHALAACRGRFAEFLAEQWSQDGHVAFGYHPAGDYFVRGEGTLTWDFGELRLSNLKPDADGKVVVKFHAVPGLAATDGSEVGEEKVLGAVWPFIALTPKSDATTLRIR